MALTAARYVDLRACMSTSHNGHTASRWAFFSLFLFFVIIQHPKITVRIQDEVLALQTYYNSYLGVDKARSASGRSTTRDAQHPESRVLNSYYFFR